MIAIWNRLKNEPAVVGGLVIAVLNLAVAKGLWHLTVEDLGILNGALGLLFGGGVRQAVYSSKSYAVLQADRDAKAEELLDQP